MIDLYNRIIPIICKQQLSKDRSLEIVKNAYNNGIEHIIAAPRLSEHPTPHTVDLFESAVSTFNDELIRRNISILISPGQLVRYNETLVEDYKSHSLLTINHSRYLLIELPEGEVPSDLAEQLYQLQLQDITPILSKPERNRYLIEQPDLLYKLVKQGILLQVLATSVTGKAGTYVKRTTEKMIGCNLVHMMTSDTDRPKTDTTNLQKALYQVENRFGKETSNFLQQNLTRIVKDHQIPFLPPERFKRKRYIGIF
ncbi:tyrosine-protein phosphatase [Alkalicoccobacillus murimartini]|uniref:Tyrosine-protein phosphatase n=1 Tax=Alkalicoccobacillus murimartini TaxID=171685 RepID=A0ABT9YIF6_9BACI|nr:CpsB/CapC family capsule biosynthesis tyrosine phosphatase [Alkalicoccobacillus murimartini]MDQ0206997.1 protein-tyrosine phosphatase [Alkalicoccobacillus murimartini]